MMINLQELGDFNDLSGSLQWAQLMAQPCCSKSSSSACPTASIAISYLSDVAQV
jgi:hypothetical protein